MSPKALPQSGKPASDAPPSPMALAPEYAASVARHLEILLARHDPKGQGSGKRAQSALARHLHVSQGTISKWLRPRKISLAQVVIIARELGLTLDQVVGYTPPGRHGRGGGGADERVGVILAALEAYDRVGGGSMPPLLPPPRPKS